MVLPAFTTLLDHQRVGTELDVDRLVGLWPADAAPDPEPEQPATATVATSAAPANPRAARLMPDT